MSEPRLGTRLQLSCLILAACSGRHPSTLRATEDAAGAPAIAPYALTPLAESVPAEPPAPSPESSAHADPPLPKPLRRASFDSLARPTYFEGYSSGNCGSTLAVDGNGRVWYEHGCEGHSSGVLSTTRLSPAEKARFNAALVKLRRIPEVKALHSCTRPSTVVLVERTGQERTWNRCAGTPDDSPEFSPVDDALSDARGR